jgi:hypothetical protein
MCETSKIWGIRTRGTISNRLKRTPLKIAGNDQALDASPLSAHKDRGEGNRKYAGALRDETQPTPVGNAGQ